MILLFRILISTALLGSIASTLSVYPHQLAYFNEASGGPWNGHKHLLGSNVDWGQDLLEVVKELGSECHYYFDGPYSCPFYLAEQIQGSVPPKLTAETISEWHSNLQHGVYIIRYSQLQSIGLQINDIKQFEDRQFTSVTCWSPSLLVFVKHKNVEDLMGCW